MDEHRPHHRFIICGTAVSVTISILTLCGLVWAVFTKPAAWDQATKDINEMKPKFEILSNSVAKMDGKLDVIIVGLGLEKHGMSR
jgi:hypothetical protein